MFLVISCNKKIAQLLIRFCELAVCQVPLGDFLFERGCGTSDSRVLSTSESLPLFLH